MTEVWQCPRCGTLHSCNVKTTQLVDWPHQWTAVVVPICRMGHEGVEMICLLQHPSLWMGEGETWEQAA